jgi:hypothetical protein
MAVVVVLILIGLAIFGSLLYFARKIGAGSQQKIAIDSFALTEPWRRHVASAESAERRFAQTLKATAPGPLHDRLAEIERGLKKGVQECWEIAKRGEELDSVLRRLEPASLRRQLELATGDEQASLRRQVESATRIETTRDETDERLRMLNVRLGELVTQSAEVSIGMDGTRELGAGVDAVVTELEALRLAVEDFKPAPRTEPPATA